MSTIFLCCVLTHGIQWTALCAKTGMEGFFIAVQGTVKDHAEPKVFFTEKAEKFICLFLNVEPQHLALWLESWIVSGISASFSHSLIFTYWPLDTLDIPTANRQCPMNHIISACCCPIQEGLSKFCSCPICCYHNDLLYIRQYLDRTWNNKECEDELH